MVRLQQVHFCERPRDRQFFGLGQPLDESPSYLRLKATCFGSGNAHLCLGRVGSCDGDYHLARTGKADYCRLGLEGWHGCGYIIASTMLDWSGLCQRLVIVVAR